MIVPLLYEQAASVKIFYLDTIVHDVIRVVSILVGRSISIYEVLNNPELKVKLMK